MALALVAGSGWDVGPVWRPADQVAPSPDLTLQPNADDADSPADWQRFADWLASGADDLVAASSAPTVGSASSGPDTDASPAPSSVPEPGPTGREREATGPVDGVDVSHWNGRVRFDLVGDAGGQFVLMKATQGPDFVDPAFRRHLAGAQAAGLLVGAYHFYDYRVGGTAQADHFIDTLDAAGALSGSLPPVVDIECFEPFGTADQAYVRHQLRAFVNRVFERTGQLPMVYTSGIMWRAVTGGADSFGDLPLWVACWHCASPGVPAGWTDWLFWQTGSTTLDDTGDRLGSDRFAGDADELRALATDFRVAGGRRATADREVRVPLRLLDGDQARLSLDRVTWTDWLSTRGSVSIRLPDRDGRYRVWVRTRTVEGVRGPLRSDAIMLDRETPRIDGPIISVGPAGPTADDRSLVVDVTTTVRDAGSGVARVTAQVDCGDGWIAVRPEIRSRRAESVAEVRVVASITVGMTCRARIRGVDRAGNTSRVTTGPFPASLVRPVDPSSATSLIPQAAASPGSLQTLP